MSRTFGFVVTAALLASVTAFAQTPSSSPSSDAAPAAAPADSAPSADAKPAHKHHHSMKSAKNGGTDHDADKLNACMSNATPTDAQAQCLKQASS